MIKNLRSTNYNKLLKIILGIIILWGIAIRVIVFLQNRDLIIDESNIARDLYEGSFGSLALPLSHEQFAPPVFLWIEKLCTLTLGFSEYSLRLYPLIAGIAGLFLLALIMKPMTSLRSAWYTVALMAVSFIYIRYSSEVKQYSPDVMITLALILLTLKTDIQKVSSRHFFLIWLLAGSVAIWASMPAVFILAGVGCHYFYICISKKDKKKLRGVISVGMIWAIQFLFYYYTILRHQVGIKGLIEYHREYFLFLIPKDLPQLAHNKDVLLDLLKQTSGYGDRAWYFNTTLAFVGIILLFKKQTARALLIVVPLLATFIAASFAQFSLIPRVSLFVMPLILILIGYGFECAMNLKFVVLKIALTVMGADVIIHHNITFDLIRHHPRYESVTDGMAFISKHQVTASKIYVSHGSAPAFIYYTQLHPAKAKWAAIKDATLLEWNSDYSMVASRCSDTAAFLFTSVTQQELSLRRASIEQHMRCIDSIESSMPSGYAYMYIRK